MFSPGGWEERPRQGLSAGLCRVRVLSRRPGISTSRRSLPTSGLRARDRSCHTRPRKLRAREHSRRPARQELMQGKGNGGWDGCANLSLSWFFHLLPVVTPNLKPEGKGARMMQPRKVWEDRRMIWKGEWGMPSTPLLANGGPALLSSPEKSLNRVRDLSFLPLYLWVHQDLKTRVHHRVLCGVGRGS